MSIVHEFDLDDPPPVQDETPAQRRRRERQEKGSKDTASKPASKTAAAKDDGNLLSRLSEGFSKLAEQLRARGDEELADAFDADKDAISRGLVSLTRTVKWLRKPLVLFVGFLEPVLAFWHVGGILLRRMFIWRDSAIANQEARAQQQQADNQAPVA